VGGTAPPYPQARILIVDDQPSDTLLVETVLRKAGYTALVSTTDPRAVPTLCLAGPPDLILLDPYMPRKDGLTVLKELRGLLESQSYLPVLVLTTNQTTQAKDRAFAAGARDYMTKPYDPAELVMRVKSLLETRVLHRALQESNRQLEARLCERTRDLDEAGREILEHLALVAEYGDDLTGQHIHRVSRLAAALARALGWSAERADLLGQAALLHDVGKIGTPDRLLLKSGPLTEDESALLKLHTRFGASLMTGSRFPVLRLAEEIALTHHERWDGTGYPNGLAGEAIPPSGRIVAVANVYDLLTHDRPARPAWSRAEARAVIAHQSGRYFDPRMVETFLRLPLDALAAAEG
jgi:putative two-component system response regulator